MPCMLLGTSLLLPAQIWPEGGDAGDLPGTAQVPLGNGALTSIAGSLTTDADMYLIQINSPGAFSATTVGGATFDTQLSLFDANGRGVAFNDDSVGFQSTISNTFVVRPGKYLLAVSAYDFDANAKGGAIWNDTPFGAERAPDGPRRLEAVDGWSGASAGGSYVIALTGASFVQNEAVFPDYQHLCESQTQLGNAGSTAWWRQTGGRFQVIYEASHLTGKAGVFGPITINALKFRGEDGEPNVGGQSWAGVTVELGSTSLDNTNMSTTFATNRDPLTTTMGPLGNTNVTVLRSLGTTPNNYNIIIDLAAISAAFPHDPTSARPNLLIDITMPVAAVVPVTSGTVMPFQDAVGIATVVRGEGINTATPAAPTGTVSAIPPVIGIEFVGGGGYSTLVPARNEFYGAACGGSHASFYQTFLQGQDFDLTGLTLVPDNPAAPTFYTVLNSAGSFDASKVNAAPNSIGDDSVITHALGFTFNYPGASTTTIKPSTNGYIWLDSTMTGSDLTGTPALLLGSSATVTSNGARLALHWMDMHAGRNTATHPNSGLHTLTDTSGGPGNAVCYVTWFNVGIFNSVSGAGVGGQVVHDMQAVFFEATGVIEMRYGSTLTAGSNSSTACVITGFSRGRVGGVQSSDPQSRDLSVEAPFATAVEVTGVNAMGQTAVAFPEAGGAHYSGRMYGGQTIRWNANNVTPGAVLGAQLVDVAPSRPGFSFPGITAPGCMLSTSAGALLWEISVLPPASVTGTVPLVVPHGFQGVDLYAQYVVLDGLFGGPDLITRSSNALRHRIGLD